MKIKVKELNLRLYVLYICIVLLLNTIMKDSYLFITMILSVNVLFIYLFRKEIKDYSILKYVFVLSAFYMILYRNLTIIRYTGYFFILVTFIYTFSIMLHLCVEKITRCFIFISIINFVICISEILLKTNYYLNFLGVNYYKASSGYRVCGITNHPITLSAVAIVFFYFFMYLYTIKKNVKYMFLSFSNLAVVFLTKSRSAYLAFGLSVLIYLIFVFLKKRSVSVRKQTVIIIMFIIISLIVISCFVGGSIFGTIINRFVQLSSDSDSGSYYQRVGSIQFIWNYMKQVKNIFKLFIGNGYGNLINYLYSNRIYFVQSGFYAVDNQYISLIYDIGLINIIVIGIKLFKDMKKNYFIMKRNRGKSSMAPLYGVLTILINIFFYEFDDKVILLLLFAFLYALLINSSEYCVQ